MAAVVISVLVWLKKRKRDPKLEDNVAYHPRNMEFETSPISAINPLSIAIQTTTNEAYTSNTYTSLNATYEVIEETAEDKDIDTKPNEAYITTGIATSVNEAYQPDNTPVYDYVRPQ